MKKMININFQGRIIPIEETSFDILQHYIGSLRTYFAQEEGRDEIINDIESRIAELFSERLKTTACITDEDVNAVISSMGRPEDFEEAESTGNYNAGPATPTKTSSAPVKEDTEPKVWRRSLNDSILGGVCGGIANYLKIDPAIVRILFAVLAIGSVGTWILVYIVLWIILPAKLMTPNAPKRFYRSKEYRVAGGVAGGLAAYFGVDVWVPRIIFAAPLLLTAIGGILNFHALEALLGGLSGTFVVVYIILWIILPEARSATAKLEMKGEKINLQSIKNTVQEDPGVVIQPRTSGLGKAIGIVFKAFFLFIAGIISLAFITAFVAILFGGIVGGTGIYPLKDFVIVSTWQNFLLWSSLVLFLAVPAIALLTWFIRRIMGIRSRRHYLGYVFGSLWFIGFISIALFVASLTDNFRIKESVEENVPVYYPVNGKLYVKVKTYLSDYTEYKKRSRRGLPFVGPNEDSLFLNSVRVDIIKSADSSYHVHKLTSATGSSTQAASIRASHVSYMLSQNDTSLMLPKEFAISKNDKFSNQQVLVVIEVPVGKKIQIDQDVRNFSWFFIGLHNGEWDNDDDWDNDWHGKYHWSANTEYIMTERGLEKTRKEKDDDDDDDDESKEAILPDSGSKHKKKNIEIGGDTVSVTL